jgi:ribosomal protein L11 methyltransferase
LIAELSEINYEGFVQNENSLLAYIDEKHFDEKSLNEIIKHHKLNFSAKKIEQKNWNEEWEKNFESIKIRDEIYLRALFHPEKSNAKLTITIQPKMSFGTGHHSTTKLMLEEMLDIDFDNKSVLDMGCGTAVLAILAEKRGAKKIIAIDNDEWAVENSKENISINHCEKIEVKIGDEKNLTVEKFDVILSNITKNFNLQNLPKYASLLNEKGMILLSGFYLEDKPDFENLASILKLELKRFQTDKNWCMLKFEN